MLLWEEIRFYVPTAEQRASWKDPSKCMVFVENVYEPLSYRIKGGIYGSKEVQRIMFASNLTEEEAEAVRLTGYAGVPIEKIAKRDKKATTPRSEWDLFQISARKAGIRIGFAPSGEPVAVFVNEDGSPQRDAAGAMVSALGHVVETEDGERTELSYKQRDGTMSQPPFVRSILAIADDFVAPPVEERREIDRTPKEGAATNTVRTSAGPTTEALVAAAETSGLIGKDADDLGDSDAQLAFANRMRTRVPIFGHAEIQAAAEAGTLLDYLADRGAIKVGDDGVITEAA